MSLDLTPTREELLRQILAGQVFRYGDGEDYDGDHNKVTYRVAQLKRAGWVELGIPGPYKTPWLLTEAGKKVSTPIVKPAGARPDHG